MTPLWLYLLGQKYTERDLEVPYLLVAASLASFVVPVCLGILFKRRWLKHSEWLTQNLSHPFFALCVVVLPIIGITSNLYYFHMVNWRHLVAGFVAGTLGFSIGAFLAWICRQGTARSSSGEALMLIATITSSRQAPDHRHFPGDGHPERGHRFRGLDALLPFSLQ